jgi:hypothetical protein
MQKYNFIEKHNKNFPIIKNLRELAKYHKNYFIFSDRIYSLDKIITSHPGGFYVIDQIRARVIDRYIYGSEPLEAPGPMKIHCHSASCMAMVGDPIGILYSIVPYLNM